MEILFVTATLPFPPTDGTRIRLYSLIKYLASRHNVSIVSFSTKEDRPEHVDALRSLCKEIRLIPLNQSYSLSAILQGLVGSVPLPILNYRDHAMAATITDMVRSTRYDIIQAEALHVAQYCAGLEGCRILDLFDIYSTVLKRYAERVGGLLRRRYAAMTSNKLVRYEAKTCPAFDECLVVSALDEAIVRTQMGVEHVSVIPNGVDLTGYTPSHQEDVDPHRVVFVGRMDYAANQEGVLWFCREVLPLVRAKRPKVLFQIVGKSPSKDVADLATPGAIEVTGFVDDVRPYLEKAAVCVVPLRVGGGTRLKILEALAMEKATVSTSMGAEGLSVVHHRDILIGDEPKEFAENIVQLLTDQGLRKRLGSAGRQLVEREYGWKSIAQRLEGVYDGALRRMQKRTSTGSNGSPKV